MCFLVTSRLLKAKVLLLNLAICFKIDHLLILRNYVLISYKTISMKSRNWILVFPNHLVTCFRLLFWLILHANDLVTRKSITGLIAYVGSTPVLWFAKHQGSIASSTYAAEFLDFRTVTEEAISLHYMIRCLGCNVPAEGKCPTRIYGDSLSAIPNSQNPVCTLSKKHVTISYNIVREAIAAGIIECFWLKDCWNLSDITTKQIPCTPFKAHCDYIYWLLNFHIHNKTCLDEDTPEWTFWLPLFNVSSYSWYQLHSSQLIKLRLYYLHYVIYNSSTSLNMYSIQD